ncbi:MAG: DUF5668 domain-containing protein [Anaerolineae bacterium]
MVSTQGNPNRSLFWPLMLIGVGAIWLLSNIGILQPASIGMLFRLWPVILIIIGLDLLLGRNNPTLGTLIGLGGVALIIALMLLGPSLGLVRSAEVKIGDYSEPLGDAKSAQVTIGVGVATTTVQALDGSKELFKADIRYLGDVEFTTTGETDKVISLSQTGSVSTTPDFFGWFDSNQDLRWNIGLSKDIPLALEINSGVSETTLDLSELKLTSLDVDGGVGKLTMSLPSMEESYNAVLKGGVGEFNVTIAKSAAVNLEVKGGVGGVVIDVPDDAAVRVDAQTGVGGINVPANYTKVSGSDQTVGENGVWETDNFNGSSRQISIRFEGGVGGLTIR